jgi:hypothetical protein
MKRCVPGILACLASLTTLTPASAAATKPPSCTVSLEQAFEASGGKAWERYAQMQVEATREQGEQRTAFSSTTDLRNGRWRDLRRHGPFELADGYDGSVAWAEWKPGDIIESNDPGKRLNVLTESYERMRAYWLPQRMRGETSCVSDKKLDGRRYSIHRLQPEGGRSFELWVDVATRTIARRVERNGIFERTARYDDYRETAGLRLPYRIDETDYSGNSQRLNISRITLSANADDTLVAKSPVRLTDYSFPAGRDQVDVPLRLLNNHLYIPVTFNGRGPHWMMLDTGAFCLVNRSFAETLELHSEGGQALHGAGSNAAQFDHAKLDTIEIGGIVLRDQRCDVIDLQSFADFEGMDQFGVVGYEVYKRLVVRQNHAGSSIRFIEPARFEPSAAAQPVPFEFFDFGPLVAGSIDGFPGRFFVDTGSRNTASPHAWFIDRHDLRERYPRSIDAVSGFGIGGAVKSQLVRSRQIKLGDVAFEAPLLDLGRGDQGAMSSEDAAALIGMGLMQRYGVVTFDYSRRRILFEQPLQQPRNDLDRSGMQMKRATAGFEILDVVAASPAAEAQLRVRDVLVSVAGRPAGQWLLPELREYLRVSPSGTQVQGEVLRRGKKRTFKLVLRDLLPTTAAVNTASDSSPRYPAT